MLHFFHSTANAHKEVVQFAVVECLIESLAAVNQLFLNNLADLRYAIQVNLVGACFIFVLFGSSQSTAGTNKLLNCCKLGLKSDSIPR